MRRSFWTALVAQFLFIAAVSFAAPGLAVWRRVAAATLFGLAWDVLSLRNPS
jgi:hypothetical protein